MYHYWCKVGLLHEIYGKTVAKLKFISLAKVKLRFVKSPEIASSHDVFSVHFGKSRLTFGRFKLRRLNLPEQALTYVQVNLGKN